MEKTEYKELSQLALFRQIKEAEMRRRRDANLADDKCHRS